MAINMYKVSVGDNYWTYTSGEYDVTTGLDTYVATPMKRTDMTFDFTQTEVTLTIPGDLEPFHLFKYVTPLLPFVVEIISYPTLVSVFKGNVLSVSFDVITNIAKVKLGSVKALEGTTCPSRTFGTTCSFELFSGDCGLNKDLFKEVVAIADIVVDNTTLTATVLGANGDHYYHGGYVQSDTGETQYIMSQVGNVVTLLGGLVTIGETTSITFYPGCNKGHTTCDTKFSNLGQFGGFPFVPYINIFTEPF